MVCLDMKTIIELRELLDFADTGWSQYTRIPVQTIHDMESETSFGVYLGDSSEYDYVRMYQTMMLNYAIKELDMSNPEKNLLYRKAQIIMSERSMKLLRRDDTFIF